jgi:hypothetical protein
MGADLYIKSTYQPNHEKYQQQFHQYATKRDAARTEAEKKRYQRKVDEYYGKMYEVGYFRDSYNNSNLLWKLGLDYWVWFAEFVNDKQELSPDNAAIVLAEIEQRKDQLGEIEDAEEQKYFQGKYDEFVAFLRQAIESDEPVYCSI